MSEQYEMQDDWKRAEAESWKRWKSPETWGNTDSGAHTHGFKAGFEYAQARAEAAEQQAARLRAALQAVMRRIDRSGNACWCPPIFDDRAFHTSDCLRARAALAGSQPAPAAEAQECLSVCSAHRQRVAGCRACHAALCDCPAPRGGLAEGEG